MFAQSSFMQVVPNLFWQYFRTSAICDSFFFSEGPQFEKYMKQIWKIILWFDCLTKPIPNKWFFASFDLCLSLGFLTYNFNLYYYQSFNNNNLGNFMTCLNFGRIWETDDSSKSSELSTGLKIT